MDPLMTRAMKKAFGLMILAIGIMAGCTVKESAELVESLLVFTSSREGITPDTKTVRIDDGSVWWGPNEEISMFYGSGTSGGCKFTSKNTSLAETVEFEGYINISGSKEFWAVYPYSTDNSCDGSSITTVIPSDQTGVEGNFSDDAFPAMAKASSMSLPFWNICGGIKFFVSRTDITSVTVKGNNSETLAGRVKVAFNADGHPEVTEVIDGQAEVTLTAPDGGCFKPGKYYYITLLPASLDGGITLTFTTASEIGTLTSDKAQTIKRCIFGVLKNVDSKVTEWESTIVEPEYVDLGLSVKWASFNVGANAPEVFGDLFAWGETIPRPASSFTQYWAAYKWCNGSGMSLTKYCYEQDYGQVDNKTVLEPEDDAATVNVGSDWRTPTSTEIDELLNNCSWDYAILNDVPGYRVTSKVSGYTDKSIFLPCPLLDNDLYNDLGCTPGTLGLYWSSSLYPQSNQHSSVAYCLAFIPSDVLWDCLNRFAGFPVRPVYGKLIPVSSITLDKSSLKLPVGNTIKMNATVTPSNASASSVLWVTGDDSIVTVDDNGNLTAHEEGTTTITVYSSNGLSASCIVNVIPPLTETGKTFEAVDLGLSVKWATFNLGAMRPEEYGEYYSWGELAPHKDEGYNWSSYMWCDGTSTSMTKYNTKSEYGLVDNFTTLLPEDDVAQVELGGDWRIPTRFELDELRDRCYRTWTTQNGINGYLLTGKKTGYTNASIFLPAAGYCSDNYVFVSGTNGFYWSSSLYTSAPDGAYYLRVYSGSFYMDVYNRYYGFSIRPVCSKD